MKGLRYLLYQLVDWSVSYLASHLANQLLNQTESKKTVSKSVSRWLQSVTECVNQLNSLSVSWLIWKSISQSVIEWVGQSVHHSIIMFVSQTVCQSISNQLVSQSCSHSFSKSPCPFLARKGVIKLAHKAVKQPISDMSHLAKRTYVTWSNFRVI